MTEVRATSGVFVKLESDKLEKVNKAISVYLSSLGYIPVTPDNLIFEPIEVFSGRAYIVKKMLCFQWRSKDRFSSIAICPSVKDLGIFYSIEAQIEVQDFDGLVVQLRSLFNVLEAVL